MSASWFPLLLSFRFLRGIRQGCRLRAVDGFVHIPAQVHALKTGVIFGERKRKAGCQVERGMPWLFFLPLGFTFSMALREDGITLREHPITLRQRGITLRETR